MKRLTYNTLKITSLIIIYLLLSINIFFSQKVSPLYFSLANEDKKAAVLFLQKIKNLSVFSQFLSMNKYIYGEGIVDEINSLEKVRKEKIIKLETLLTKNPRSRDVLYNLYLLYKDGGNNIVAMQYLEKAREIDPTLNR